MTLAFFAALTASPSSTLLVRRSRAFCVRRTRVRRIAGITGGAASPPEACAAGSTACGDEAAAGEAAARPAAMATGNRALRGSMGLLSGSSTAARAVIDEGGGHEADSDASPDRHQSRPAIGR